MTKFTIAEQFDVFASNILNEYMVTYLAEKLGVKPDSLLKLGLGYDLTNRSHTYDMPERDDKGNIIGIVQRFEDGKKIMVKGSKRGLTYQLNPDFLSGEERYKPGKHNWVRVADAGIECPICKKPDWCLVSSENPADPAAVICSRISEGSVKSVRDSGHLHILKPGGHVTTGSILCGSKLPYLVTEGYSDTAAAYDLGFIAVGKPNFGSNKFLVELLKGRDVIIVGDNNPDGKKGMEATYQDLSKVCPKLIKVVPPPEYKDLRKWKNSVGLTQTSFLEWVVQNGEVGGDPSIFQDDVAHSIAKIWLDQEMREDGLPKIRCYHGQWVKYSDGHYENCDTEIFRGHIYRYLDGKQYIKAGAKGSEIVPYKPTRAKVSDIVDALSDWCTIDEDPPTWLKEMDRPDPANLIAFRNGILDVDKYIEGEIKLYPPTPALFSFNILPYDFDEDAHSDLWEQFYKQIFSGDQDQIDLLAQWFGYNCVPDMSYEKLLFCTGRPRSGKGTVINTLISMLGRNQCVSTSFQTLCTEFGYQPLIGKLAALLPDARTPKQRESEAALEKILQVVGRDPVGIRRMYLPYLSQVNLKCRFTIAMNDLPNIPDQANALEPRLNMLYFGNSYVGREDTTLKFRLQQEAAEGKVINFALQGLKDLREKKRFTVSREARGLLTQLRELTTPVSAFILDCCEPMPPGSNEADYFVAKDYLYEAWTRWCKEHGRRPGIKEQFGRWFTSSCPTAAPARVTLNGRRQYIFRNVRLAKWVHVQWLGLE